MSAQLYRTAQATVTTAGTITLNFGSPGQGYTWTGTVNVYNALGNEQWQVAVGGLPWGAFNGYSPFGPVQVEANGVLTITATGLTPGTAYQAVLIGSLDNTANAQPTGPGPMPLTIAQIAGAIAVNQGQYDFGDLFFSSSATPRSFNLTVPTVPTINSLVLFGRLTRPGGNYLGAKVEIFSGGTSIEYWVARPFANAAIYPYGGVGASPMVLAAFPFPGQIEAGNTISVIVTPTGTSQLDLHLVGYEAVAPPFTPPPVVAGGANGSASINGSSVGAGINILPALTDGRQYRIWNASAALTNGSGGGALTAGVIGYIFGSSVLVYAASGGGSSVSPAGGSIQGAGPIEISIQPPPGGVGTGTILGTVTYDYV